MYVYKKRRETRQNEPFVRADGAPKAFSTKMLEMGSKLMQSKAPLKGFFFNQLYY